MMSSPKVTFSSVKTFDANIDNIGNFVLVVRNSNKIFNYQIPKRNTPVCNGFDGKNIAKFVGIEIIANTLILKLKYHEHIISLISY